MATIQVILYTNYQKKKTGSKALAAGSTTAG